MPDLSRQGDMLADLRRYNDLLTEANLGGGEEAVRQVTRRLGETDLFFFLVKILHREDAARPWIYARIREVEADPFAVIDLWARFHYKSTIKTLAWLLQRIAINSNETHCILSQTRPLAKDFLEVIKRECETNSMLHWLWPESFWLDPKRESSCWTREELLLPRTVNRREKTVEAYGLTDGLPTGPHYDYRHYDDVVTRESITSPEMIHKTNRAYTDSQALRTEAVGRELNTGTTWAHNDTYRYMQDELHMAVRLHPCVQRKPTPAGYVDEPVLLTEEQIEILRRKMGPYTFAAQMMLSPIEDAQRRFDPDRLVYYEPLTYSMHLPSANLCLLVDPANSKKKHADYTAMWVVALCNDNHYRIVDGLRDRLSLPERVAAVFAFVRQYQGISPIKFVGYEEYGLQVDRVVIEHEQARQGFHFHITPLGGPLSKDDRISKLAQIFVERRLLIPQTMPRVDCRNVSYDLTQTFINEEYRPYPSHGAGWHDDLLDALSRLLDPDFNLPFPRLLTQQLPSAEERYWAEEYKRGVGPRRRDQFAM